MANPTSNFGWQMPTPVDLVTDLPADFEVFGQAVDTSLADLKGGTSGQVLSKNSNTDMDFVWVTSDDANAIQNAIVNAKGDIIGASANDTPAITSVGANGEMLVADSTTSTGLDWKSATEQYPWAAYAQTPGGITIGNGTLSSRYQQIGKTVNVEILFTLGSTSAVTGTPTFALPAGLVAKISSYTFNGTVSLGDYGAATYVGLANNPTGTGVYIAAFSTSGTYGVETGTISATVPFTWTTNDYIAIKMTYEAN
jgi:hypothetical protein